MNYFKECKSIEDVKKMYKKLAVKLHPDTNKEKDTTKEFIEMSNQYEKAFEKFKNTFVNSDGETYTKENNEMPEIFKDIIDNIIHFEDITIDIIGNWIWLSGNTFEYKKEIKDLKFKWAKNKKAWYYHEGEYVKRSKKKMSLDDLKEIYESSEIKTKSKLRLA